MSAYNGDYADLVSTLAGSQSSFKLSNGNTYPAVARPWGMNFWTPQTGKNGDGWVYTYDSFTIRGFKQTHQPSPWINDYGEFSIMPVADRTLVGQDRRVSIFSHKSETAKPYYYKVYLADPNVTVEMTATSRAAAFDFTYPAGDTSAIIIDAYDKGSYISWADKRTVVGYTTRNSGGVPSNFKNWFVVRFPKDISSVNYYVDGNSVTPEKGGGITGGQSKEISSAKGDHVEVSVCFPTSEKEKVLVYAASSFISLHQAFTNLKEVEGKSFNGIKEESRMVWNDILGHISASGGTSEQYKTFYSCLYRSVLFPRAFWEVTAKGDTVHYSPYNGKICRGLLYTDSGFWDTFRALNPLLNLIYPATATKIQRGLYNAYRESGFFPEWASPGHRNCMVGNNSASVVADAYLKGFATNLGVKMYEGLIHGANSVDPDVSSTGRLGYESYNKLGYIPCDAGINESAARTLEYAYDDWCIYKMGEKLGRPQNELEVYKKRSQNYRNLFDPSHDLMRGRKADGSFETPFSPYKWGGVFTEGNSWHYTWSVFQDINGLIELMGGPEKFTSMLDSVFVVPPVYDDSYYGFRIHEIAEMQIADMGNYAHGNQPAQHMIYLYDYVNHPHKVQYWVREVMNRLYLPTPDGYCGDEDNGQTSAWYVFSAMGFYPVCPVSGEYALGAPLFGHIVLNLENGRKVCIDAPDNSAANRYAKKIFVNGKLNKTNFIKYDDLIKGGSLKFDMTDK